jgi:flagellar biosynthesis chaperone FliJ
LAQVLKCELEGLHAEYERVSHRYDQLFSKRTEYADQLVRKIQAQAAYASGEKEYAKQLKKLQTNVETNNNGEAIDEPVITQTMEALEYTTRMMSEKRAEAHRWVELLEEAIETFDEELETLRPKLVDVHRRRDEYMIKLRDAYVHPDHIDKMLTNVSTNMSLENDRVTLILLSIPLKWSAETWFTTNSSKEAALKAIREQKSQLPEGRRDGVFVIRPSQTHVGFFALNISIGGTIQSSLIQYKDPSMDDIAGFGFHGTDMFFATLVDFVRYYTAYKLKEHNPLLDTTLNMPAFAPADMINEELEETL